MNDLKTKTGELNKHLRGNKVFAVVSALIMVVVLVLQVVLVMKMGLLWII